MPSNQMSTIVLFISFLAILLNVPSVSSSSHDDKWGGSFGQGADEAARRAGKRPAGEEGSRGPRIIYEPSAAHVVHTDPANFRNVVQQLTGQNAPSLNQGHRMRHQAGTMHGRRPSRFFMEQQQMQPPHQQQYPHQQEYSQRQMVQQHPQDIDSLENSLQNINQRLDNLRRSSAWNQRNEVANQIAQLEEERRGIMRQLGELATRGI